MIIFETYSHVELIKFLCVTLLSGMGFGFCWRAFFQFF